MNRPDIEQASARCLTSKQVAAPKWPSVYKIFQVVLFACAIAVTSPLRAQDPAHADLAQVLMNLRSADPKVVSANAEKLATYPYREAESALLGLVQNQVSRGADGVNTFILGAAIKGLDAIGTSASVEALSQLRDQFASLSTGRLNQTTKDRTTQNIMLAIQKMQDRMNPLPSGVIIVLPKNSPIRISNGLRSLEIGGVKHEFVGDKIRDFANNGNEAAKVISSTATEFLTDSVLEEIAKKDEFKILGRDAEAKAALRTLLRIKGKNPVLVGPAGAGKTMIAQRLAQIVATELPSDPLYDELRFATVIETSPARISRLANSNSSASQASAVEQFFDSVLEMEAKLKHPIIVFIDEVHTLSPDQVEAMKPYLDSRKRAIKFIGASTGREFSMKFKHNDAIKRRLKLIEVQEFSVEQTIEIVKQTWEGQVERHYGVQFSPESVKSIVQNAKKVEPDSGRFDASIKIMQDIAIIEKDAAPGPGVLALGEAQVDSFLQKQLGYPVNAKDGRALQTYRDELTQKLNSEVLFQESMTESTVDLWMELMGDHLRGVRVQALLGPTGTGKSQLGRSLAKHVFARDGAFLEIDANVYQTGGYSVGTLIGAPNGVKSSDVTSGVLMDYLDDPSRGKFGGVILINEAERMPKEAWERLMEMLDTGEIIGGDGKLRTLTRHLVILTSNRVDQVIFPKGIERLTDTEMDRHIRSYDNDQLRDAYKEKSSGHDEFVLPDPVIARIDRWSLAKPISLSMAQEIAKKASEKMILNLNERFSVTIELAADASRAIAERSFQPGMGARPVVKAVQSLLQKLVTEAVAHTKIIRNQVIHIAADDGELKANMAGGKSVSLSLPKPQLTDALDDPGFRKKMETLLPKLRERIIGQDDATQAIARAVLAQQSDPSPKKRPIALFLVGSTGTGKTSIAKALARALYQNEERAEVIDLGKVNFEGKLNTIFGSEKGYEGNKDLSQFEAILRRNPQGGVIVFDEASNMGGGDKARKEALFKQGFYSLIEEGKWLSSATGKTYDLGKFVFIFNGNDGEKLFQNIDADDLRMAEYERNKERSKVQKLLIEAGVPEAFLGRMIGVILMKPLLSAEIRQVTKMLLNDVLDPYQGRGLKFEIDPSFSEMTAMAFYSRDQGARSIRALFDSDLKATLADFIFKAGGLQVLKGQTIRMSLNDTLSKRPFVTKLNEKRRVELTLEIHDGSGHVIETLTEDLATKAAKINKQSFHDARATAIHEAGHAIVNSPELTGQNLAHLTIVGSGNFAGYARYEEIEIKKKSFTLQTLAAKAAMALAGSKAQELDGQEKDAGWMSDREQTNKLISRSIFEFGLIPELRNVLYREGKPHYTVDQLRAAKLASDRIFAEAEAKAEAVLRARWSLVRDVSAKLLKQGSMSGTEFYAMEKASLTVPPKDQPANSPVKRPRIDGGNAIRCEAIFSESVR